MEVEERGGCVVRGEIQKWSISGLVQCAPSMWRRKVWPNREGAMGAIHKVRPNNPFFCPGSHENNKTQISRFIEEKYTRKRQNDRGM